MNLSLLVFLSQKTIVTDARFSTYLTVTFLCFSFIPLSLSADCSHQRLQICDQNHAHKVSSTACLCITLCHSPGEIDLLLILSLISYCQATPVKVSILAKHTCSRKCNGGGFTTVRQRFCESDSTGLAFPLIDVD